jgi:tetratricopeptide (TPR) repeat protein
VLNAKDATIFNNRGSTYRALGKIELAIVDYSAAIQIDPRYATAYVNRGNALIQTKDYKRALDDFEAALRIDPALESAITGRDLVKDAATR